MDEPARHLEPPTVRTSADELGPVLERCRDYLLQIAQQELDPALQAKGGASDLVQQTMLDAVRDFENFHGNAESDLRAWLHRLLLNNLVDFARRFRTDKRQLSRERPLQGPTSSKDLGAALPADASSPSEQAVGREQDLAIQQAVGRLPEDYQRVLQLRFQDDCSFAEIGRVLDLSANAARKLWARALKRLQQEMEGPPHESG